jgi:hypothetical protein
LLWAFPVYTLVFLSIWSIVRKEAGMTTRSGTRAAAALALALLALAACVHAHKPLPFGQEHGDAGHALLVRDIDVSQVTYSEVTASSPQYWLAIDAPQSASLSL